MSDDASPTGDPQKAALQGLLQVIALRNRPRTSQLLAESPELARVAIKAGATRELAGANYFKEIAHYAYAGDTPLHFAAAASHEEQAKIIRLLRGQGARPSNRDATGKSVNDCVHAGWIHTLRGET